MLYRRFKEDSLSLLGYGCMRLPVKGDDQGCIDEDETRRLISRAFEAGINYFDTAYSYHLGKSEIVIGKILREHPRDSYRLASKFPGHEKRSSYDVDAIFREQLEKCQVDYFDYYLLHNVCEFSIDTYMDERWGIVDYLARQRDNGAIRHLGFSTHGRLETIKRFLDRFGEKMEFCQIELNYIDWVLQDAESTVKLLHDYGLPIWVMEPCRGGRLAKLDESSEKKLRSLRPDSSIASWAFRWLQDIEDVRLILSGMSTYEQLEDNIATFSSTAPLSDAERSALDEIAQGMLSMVPCTECRYCTRVCPKGLDIPGFMFRYNDALFQPDLRQSMNMEGLPPEKKPTACIACGACKTACPQGIDIPAALEDFARITATLPVWTELRKYE